METPLIGPWYYVYLHPRWRLFARPTPSDPEMFCGHPQYWWEICCNVIGPHYGLSRHKGNVRIAELCYSMPRGRCSIRLSRGSQPQFGLFHGDDFPSSLNAETQKKRLVRTFGLGAATQQGQVQFLHDEHERMIPDDRQRLQELLDITIPY